MRPFGRISHLFLARETPSSGEPALNARYRRNVSLGWLITALSTASIGDRESPTLPPHRQERALSRSRLNDWIEPPVVVPVLLLLFLAAVVLWRG